MVEHNQSANNPTNGGYNNAYKFNGKELDDATGMYYYGARYYDPRISIFVSVDPLAEQTMEPYLYTGNNPIMFTDPTGMSKDGIIVGNDNSTNKTASSALTEFAATNEGRSFLADYAKKGDKVGNETFTEDGKYHKQGVDLVFDFKKIGAKGKTTNSIKNGRGQINVTIDNSTYVESQDGQIYDMRGYFTDKTTDKFQKALISRGITIVHETFIHVFGSTQDYLNDGKFDNSHIDPAIKLKYSRRQTSHWDHYNIQIGSSKSKEIFNTNGLNAIMQLNSRVNFGRHYSESDLSRMMWNFSGSWKR